MYTLGSDLRHSSAPMLRFNRAFKILNHEAPCISISSMDASRLLGMEGSRQSRLKLRHVGAHKANAPSSAWRPPPRVQRPQNNNAPWVLMLACPKPVRCSSSAPWDGCPRARGCPGSRPQRTRVPPPDGGTGGASPIAFSTANPPQHCSPSNFHTSRCRLLAHEP